MWWLINIEIGFLEWVVGNDLEARVWKTITKSWRTSIRYIRGFPIHSGFQTEMWTDGFDAPIPTDESAYARKLLLVQMLPMSLMWIQVVNVLSNRRFLHLHLDQYLHLDVLLFQQGQLLIQPGLLAGEDTGSSFQSFRYYPLPSSVKSLGKRLYPLWTIRTPTLIRLEMVRHTSSCLICSGENGSVWNEQCVDRSISYKHCIDTDMHISPARVSRPAKTWRYRG